MTATAFLTSAIFPQGIGDNRSEAEARADRARKALVAAATETVLEDRYPATIRMLGRGKAAERALRLVRDDFQEGQEFARHVGDAFQALGMGLK